MDLRVLIVEDHGATLAAMREYFEGAGFRVDTARHLEEALQLVERRGYALAITDLRLERGGGADGLEVVSAVRRRDARTPVLMITASATPQVEAEARRRGAAAVLPKPQPLARVLQTALTLIRARPVA